MQIGAAVEAVDGKGYLYECVLSSENPKRAELTVRSVRALPPVWSPVTITVAVAPTKNMDRMEWLTEKLTEIGVNRIVPLLCRHSERRDIKTERLEKIAVSAMKQSLKAVLPQIDALTPVNDFLKECNGSPAQKFVGYCDSSTPRLLLAKAYETGRDVVLMIGPEGDFSPEEITAAREAGFQAVTMGDNRLRTETAALVAADTVHILNQRFSGR